MLLGFKRRFAPFVEDGSKTHTIRATRKRPPRVGEMCHCYVDPRQKTMRLLGRWPCVSVQQFSIDRRGLIRIDGIPLTADEANALAYRDGFRSRGLTGAYAEMMDYWVDRLPFKGTVIHWDHRRPFQPFPLHDHNGAL